MIGFVISAACLVGLIAVLRQGRRHRRHGFRGGRQRFIYRVFERLDTSPGQEKEIRDVLNAFWEEAKAAKEELRSSRGQLAEAIRGEQLDTDKLAALYAQQDESIAKMRTLFTDSLSRVHGVLDERQRRRLAEMLESGPFSFRSGPYRSARGGAW